MGLFTSVYWEIYWEGGRGGVGWVWLGELDLMVTTSGTYEFMADVKKAGNEWHMCSRQGQLSITLLTPSSAYCTHR